MARYIDADKLLENLKKQYGEDLGWQCTVNMSDVGMMIEDAPTADMVEVVRCSECIYCENMKCTELKDNTGHSLDVATFDYCSQGVRKERRTDNDV